MADSKGMCPHRQYMDDPNIVWREGKPDFTQVNKAYLEGRTRVHKEGSLEKIVEDLVKTWEMEASHKTRIEVTLEFSTKDQYMCFSHKYHLALRDSDCLSFACMGKPVCSQFGQMVSKIQDW